MMSWIHFHGTWLWDEVLHVSIKTEFEVGKYIVIIQSIRESSVQILFSELLIFVCFRLCLKDMAFYLFFASIYFCASKALFTWSESNMHIYNSIVASTSVNMYEIHTARECSSNPFIWPVFYEAHPKKRFWRPPPTFCKSKKQKRRKSCTSLRGGPQLWRPPHRSCWDCGKGYYATASGWITEYRMHSYYKRMCEHLNIQMYKL